MLDDRWNILKVSVSARCAHLFKEDLLLSNIILPTLPFISPLPSLLPSILLPTPCLPFLLCSLSSFQLLGQTGKEIREPSQLKRHFLLKEVGFHWLSGMTKKLLSNPVKIWILAFSYSCQEWFSLHQKSKIVCSYGGWACQLCTENRYF